MYSSGPLWRRRAQAVSQSVEQATEQANTSVYLFGQHYVKPCLDSVASCLTTCVDAGCPSLNLSQRDRLRRQRGRARSRGGAELNFDFYDDWDDLDENDGLLGWGGNDEFDRLLAGSAAGYGAVSQQPARQRGMSYPKARRKSAAQIEAEDPTVIPCSQGFFSRMFGGKVLRYKPSAADLQEHPGARRKGRDLTEGEALLEESEDGRGRQKRHMRNRSLTASSGNTTDSFSSRGDIFPSDEEDAIPLDDEFAMVLERRNTNPVIETESSSNRTGSDKRAKRPSVGSRNSTRRTMSSRSIRSSLGKKSRSRAESNAQTPIEEHTPDMVEEPAEFVEPPSLTELKHEEQRIAEEEEAEVQRWRSKAQRLAADRGLPGDSRQDNELPSKEATPEPASPQIKAAELIPAIQHNGMDVEAGEGPPASVNVAADGNRTEEGAD